MAYTKDEIKKFEEKDKRINRVAICKSLIESKTFTKEEILNETDKIFGVAECFVEYVYNGLTMDKPKQEVQYDYPDWIQYAQVDNFTVPTQEQIKILDVLWAEYKTVCPEQELLNMKPEKLLSNLLKEFSAYPSKQNSISIVLRKIKLKQLM